MRPISLISLQGLIGSAIRKQQQYIRDQEKHLKDLERSYSHLCGGDTKGTLYAAELFVKPEPAIKPAPEPATESSHTVEPIAVPVEAAKPVPATEHPLKPDQAIMPAIMPAITLKALRLKTGLTQRYFAEKLNVSQVLVSKMESANDLTVSKIENYVGAIDGRLTLIVEFDDNPAIAIRLTKKVI